MKNLPAQLPGDAMVEKAKRWREEQEQQAHDASIRGAQVEFMCIYLDICLWLLTFKFSTIFKNRFYLNSILYIFSGV